MSSQVTLLIKLQEVMRAYRRKNGGKKMSNEILAARTGIPKNRVDSIGGRPGYNASLSDLALICKTLGTTPAKLLEVGKDPRAPARRKKTTGAKKRKRAKKRKKAKKSKKSKKG